MSSNTFTTNTSWTNGPLPTATAIVSVVGTWGSGTMTIAVLDSSGNAVTVDTATSDYRKEVTIGKGRRYRLTLSGSSGANLVATVMDVQQ